jgi:hypothetical protein
VTNSIDTILIFSLEKEHAAQLQDLERCERSFRDGLTGLKTYFNFMCSDEAATLSDMELYNRVVRDNISQLACDCLLVMAFIVDSSEGDNQSAQRDARSLARPIRKLVLKFLIDTVKEPLKTVKKQTGLFESSAIEGLSLSLKIPRAKFGLDYSLKTHLQNMIRELSNSFIYESSKHYSRDLQSVEKAFSSFANELEHALAQHLVATTIPEIEDTSLIDQLSSLEIDTKPDNVSLETRPFSTINGTRQLSRPVVTVAASLPQNTIPRVCFQCKQPGHFKDKCPQTRCYRCKN